MAGIQEQQESKEQEYYDGFLSDESFIELTFELAFGDSAIHNGYTRKEVLEKLREFSDTALNVENSV